MTLTIKGKPLDPQLKAPTSLAACYDVAAALSKNANRSLCAAIGICWGHKQAPKATLSGHKFDVLAYGGAIMDELLGLGASMEEISEVGGLAITLVSDQIVGKDEMKETEGNSDAPTV